MSEFAFIAQTPHTAFLFPGQGSQQVGMGQDVARAYPAAHATYEEADDLLGFALSRLCFEGPEAELTDTINAQPALLVTSVAILRAIASELGGQAPRSNGLGGATFVAGHSMGEYSALVAAGSLSFADGLRLVRRRGELMKAAGLEQPGLMAAILGLDEAQVAAICAAATAAGGIAQVANDNCPGQVVISGDRAGMEAAMAALAAAGARKVVPLAVSIAAHSPLMQPVAEALSREIDATPMTPPSVPVVGNTQAQPLSSVAAIRAELAAQLTGSVRWTASMQTLLAAGVTRVVEVGPGDVLVGLMRRIDRTAQREVVHSPEDVRSFVASLI
jgi:[acyl-carrier-protein] S-malonyltransferase